MSAIFVEFILADVSGYTERTIFINPRHVTFVTNSPQHAQISEVGLVGPQGSALVRGTPTDVVAHLTGAVADDVPETWRTIP
jgi:hypothetical protein